MIDTEKISKIAKAVAHRDQNFDAITEWEQAALKESDQSADQLNILAEMMRGAATEVFITELRLIFEN